MKVKLLKEIETRSIIKECHECIMEFEDCDKCNEIMNMLTGIDCITNEVIFVYEEKIKEK